MEREISDWQRVRQRCSGRPVTAQNLCQMNMPNYKAKLYWYSRQHELCFFLLCNITCCNVTIWTNILSYVSIYRKYYLFTPPARYWTNEIKSTLKTTDKQQMAYKRFRIVFQHKMSDERFKNISVSLQFMDCNLNNVHLKVEGRNCMCTVHIITLSH